MIGFAARHGLIACQHKAFACKQHDGNGNANESSSVGTTSSEYATGIGLLKQS
jgi:hypothetical protein